MGKYHIASDGSAKPCKASVKPCPRGGAESHREFDSPEAAQRWAERKLEIETMSVGLRKARIARRVSAALAGAEGHWDVVPASEVSETAEALVSSVTRENYAATAAALDAMAASNKESIVDPYRARLAATSL